MYRKANHMGGDFRFIKQYDGDSAFAVGATSTNYYTEKGVILQWDGVQWTTVSSGEYDQINDIWNISPDEYYAVGNGGLTLKWNGVVGPESRN